VSNVNFSLFNIVAGGGAQDQLTNIQGLSIDGSTLIAPSITTSANNTLVGSGLSQSVIGTAAGSRTGAQSGRGNVGIDFGSNLLQSLSFTFGSTNAFADPAYQHFGIYNITYTPVPEVGPGTFSVVSCLAAAALIASHRGRQRR
jgi:hypothetical protein